MIKIIKHLKPFTGAIIITVVLLFVQAMTDLSLPDYMSDIVNVGIQQSGVENAVPKVIRESEFEKLLIFIKDEDKEIVKNNYTLLDKNDTSIQNIDKYLQDYPTLNDENLYKLNTKDKNVIEELNLILGKPILLVSMLEQGGIEALPGGADMLEKMSEGMAQNPSAPQADLSKADPFVLFSQLPKEEIENIQNEMDKGFADMPESIITQGATKYIHDEYDNVGIDTDKMQSNYVLLSGAKMVGIALLGMIASIIVGFIAAKVAAGLGRNLRRDVFKNVVGFSNAEFDKYSTASLITRSTNDIQQVQMLMVMLLRIVFYAPILGVGGIIKVLNTKTSMGWVIAVAVMSILSLVIILFSIAIPKFKSVQKLIDKLNLVTRESLTGMLVIRAFSTQKYEEKKFDEANNNLTKTNLFVSRLMTVMMPMMMLIMNGITLLIVWVGAYRIEEGVLQVGGMMAFIQYAMQIIMAFLMISMVSIMLPRASVSAQRIAEVIDTKVSIKDPKKPQKFDTNKKGIVEFKNVGFKYPGAEENVINNVTFTARPGETTAFIGSTGSGKSTLINLIPRFYDITEGEILIDGVDIRNVSQHDLRAKIGYVPQKGILFSGDIESNLKYGKQDLTEKEMLKASEIAQAMEFIGSKEEGFKTEISQGGSNVSGGQKQRLSIARALAKNPEVFIFDDSFSALDFKTDAALRKSLKQEIKGTMLIVAQRISTIMHAEQIIVLDEGNVVGMGTHQELMKNCEVYKQIALSQLSKEELDNEYK